MDYYYNIDSGDVRVGRSAIKNSKTSSYGEANAVQISNSNVTQDEIAHFRFRIPNLVTQCTIFSPLSWLQTERFKRAFKLVAILKI